MGKLPGKFLWGGKKCGYDLKLRLLDCFITMGGLEIGCCGRLSGALVQRVPRAGFEVV